MIRLEGNSWLLMTTLSPGCLGGIFQQRDFVGRTGIDQALQLLTQCLFGLHPAWIVAGAETGVLFREGLHGIGCTAWPG
jgi:hypothetical protein